MQKKKTNGDGVYLQGMKTLKIPTMPARADMYPIPPLE
jgi:hypothetical protein